MASQRTQADRATRDALREQARGLEHRIVEAVRADYPNLHGWHMRNPSYHTIVRTGEGPDDWRWGAYRSARAEIAALRKYLESAASVAARRISEAYGMGVGEAWAKRHGFAADDADATARAQAEVSVAAVL